MKMFEKHGMTNVAYWTPQDSPGKDNTLIYVISHPSREAAKKNWADFSADPEWQKIAADSQKDGKIVEKVESVFVDATIIRRSSKSGSRLARHGLQLAPGEHDVTRRAPRLRNFAAPRPAIRVLGSPQLCCGASRHDHCHRRRPACHRPGQRG
jgi:hypothetical protein